MYGFKCMNEQESCIKGFIIMATLKIFRQRSHTPMKIGKSMRHKLRPRLIESLIFHATLARFPRTDYAKHWEIVSF